MDWEEQLAIGELQRLSKDKLFLVEHQIKKCLCQIEGCNGFTKIFDFGISPEFYTRWGWKDLNYMKYFCSKHQYRHRIKGNFKSKKGFAIKHIIDF